MDNRKFILATGSEIWRDYIHERYLAIEREVDEEIVFYLTMMLKENVHNYTLCEKSIALGFLQSQLSGRVCNLKVLADNCLLLCGLFPEYVEKRGVGYDFYATIGKLSYSKIGHIYLNNDSYNADYFFKMSNKFDVAARVINVSNFQGI